MYGVGGIQAVSLPRPYYNICMVLTAIRRAYTTTTSIVTTSTSPATAPPASSPSSAGTSFLTHLVSSLARRTVGAG